STGEDDAELAGSTGVPIGGVGGVLLVTDAHRRDAAVTHDCVVDRQVVNAHDPEDMINVELLERGDDCLATGHLGAGHGLPRPSWRSAGQHFTDTFRAPPVRSWAIWKASPMRSRGRMWLSRGATSIWPPLIRSTAQR